MSVTVCLPEVSVGTTTSVMAAAEVKVSRWARAVVSTVKESAPAEVPDVVLTVTLSLELVAVIGVQAVALSAPWPWWPAPRTWR